MPLDSANVTEVVKLYCHSYFLLRVYKVTKYREITDWRSSVSCELFFFMWTEYGTMV